MIDEGYQTGAINDQVSEEWFEFLRLGPPIARIDSPKTRQRSAFPGQRSCLRVTGSALVVDGGNV